MNTIITMLGYLITVGAVLLWVFLSRQDRIPRTCRSGIGIALRILPLFLLFLLACQWLAVSGVLGFVVLGIAFLVLLSGPFGLNPLSMGTVGILYVIQQWVLGWPDQGESVLEPPSPRGNRHAHLDELVGRTGTTSTALRPTGRVALGEDEHAACSDLSYIERGTCVRVVGRRGPSLLVRPLDT